MPEYHPLTERLPLSRKVAGTARVGVAPMIMNVPLTERPPITAAIASALVTVAKIARSAARLVQLPPQGLESDYRCNRVLLVVVRAFFVLTPRNRDSTVTAAGGVLNCQVPQSAESEHSNEFARPRSAVAETVICGESRAHHRSGFRRR